MNFTDKEIKKLLQEADRKRDELISQCRNGDKDAFGQFIEKYQDDVFSHVYRRLGKKRKALKITCMIFVDAYKSFSEFHGDISVKVWLFRIAEKHIQAALHTRKKLAWQQGFGFFRKIKDRGKSSKHPKSEEASAEGTDALLTAYLDGD